MAKFIPPNNQLNNISSKKSKRIFSDRQNQSILRQSRRLIRDAYSPDAFEQVGNLKAVVLEIVSRFENTADTSWKYSKTVAMANQNKAVPFAEIRIRVPELHSHLPEPRDPSDSAAISKHPIALLFQTTDGSVPEIGDIVEVDFADKNNFKDAFITSVTSKSSQNATPAVDVSCSTSDTFNSAIPSLNTTQASGDAQTASSLSVSGDPSPNSSTIGAEFEGGFADNEYPKANYFASLKEFNSMTEFNNYSQTVQVMRDKGVFNISIQVSDGDSTLQDAERLVKIAAILREVNIGVYLWTKITPESFLEPLEHMLSLSKQAQVSGFFVMPTGEWNEQDSGIVNVRSSFSAREMGIKYGLMITDTESNFNYTEDAEIIYILRNHLDNYEENKFIPYRDGGASYGYGLYHLAGYNFLPNDDDPCLDGSRSPVVLDRELTLGSFWGSINNENVGFLEYSLLNQEFAKVIEGKTGNLQNLLSTSKKIETLSKANLRVSSSNERTKEPPVFNSETSGAQDVSSTPPPANSFIAGLQCSAAAIGALPFVSEPPQPSFRFSSISNSQNLLWTTDPDRILTQAHVNFLNKLAQKVYQKIPLTDPIFSSTDSKKLRITDAVRTPEKQVYLMWDKLKKKSAAQVLSLYGNAPWAKKVIEAYPSNFQQAVQVVKNRVAQGSSQGGHLYGNGVDIGTIYNLHAEGARSLNPFQKVTEAKMKSTRFVQVVTQACRELGASFVVEDYQEHIHITFPV